MKLLSNKKFFLVSFLILYFIPSQSAEFEINFIETFDEDYMLEVIQELKYEKNMRKIKKIALRKICVKNSIFVGRFSVQKLKF